MFADPEERTKVKICGLTNLQDVRFASGALVQYLGFIFYEGSPRFVEPAQAGVMINWIEGPDCVGVFVNQPLDDVNMISRQTGIDYVQLHGNESPEYCSLVDKPIIKVIHIEANTTPDELNNQINTYADQVDFLMFDTKIESQWGGTGQSFNWDILDEVAQGIPFFLSGGLKAGNIRDACKQVHPYAIDVASGVESEPGQKDYQKIEAFMNEMRDIWDKQEVGEL